MSDSSGRILAGLLEARTGQQLTLNRRWRIDTALASVMREGGFATLDKLVRSLTLEDNSALADAVVEALLNNETYFFRDRAPFDLLLNGPLKQLEEARSAVKRLSIWCAGCSTGQEAYSLAMAFAEAETRWREWRIDIVGTDISRSAIAQAKEGLYSQFEVQRGLPVRQMVRWFRETDRGRWRIAPELRDAVRFETGNLTGTPPHPGRFDIILCRNVLLYFCQRVRQKAFIRLAEAIAPDGVLMLGAAETVIGQTDLFLSDPDHRGLYRPMSAAGKQPVAKVA